MISQFIRKLINKENTVLRKKTLLFVACVGIALVLIGNFFSIDDKNETIRMEDPLETIANSTEYPTISEIEKMYEDSLILLLNDVAGISEVNVMINVDSTYIQIYESEQTSRQQITDETDTNGGKRKVEDQTDEKITSFKRTNSEEVPIHIQTKKPAIRGILITAKGVDNPQKKIEITEAVARLFDIPTFRISVMAK